MKQRRIGSVILCLLIISLCVGGINIPASAAETRTEYRYHRYRDNNGNVSVCSYYGNWKYGTSSMQIEYTDWMQIPLEIDNGKYSCYTHVYQGTSCDNAGCIDPSIDTNRHVDKNGTYWFYEETKVVEVMPVATPTPIPTVAPTSTPASTTVPTVAPTPTVTPEPPKKIELEIYAIPFLEVPEDENTIWDEIGYGLLEYAIDIFDCMVDALSPEDELKVTKALLSNKELLKNLLKTEFIGKIEDEDILNQLLEVVKNTENIEGVSDEVLSETAALLYKVIEKQPELRDHIIVTLLKYSPRLVLKVATWSCGDKIPLMDLLLGIFETSAERFWNLGEALAQYQDAISAVEDSLVARYDNLVLHHYKFIHKVTVLGLEDKSQGGPIHQNEVIACESSMDEIRDGICTSIDDTLTFWFRLFHPGKTKHLKEIMSELNRLEFDYMKYYLDVIEK